MDDVSMNKLLGLALVAALAGSVSGGPFRRSNTVAVCSGGACAPAPAAAGKQSVGTGTAQGAAVIIASLGRLRHLGGNRGAEGIGLGSTPDQAIRNCCFYGRLTPADIGTARMANGQYVAVIRYR